MEVVFEWIVGLEKEQALMLLVGIALIMALVPFFPGITRVLRVLFSNETPRIVDFSWRFIPDFKFKHATDMPLFVIKSENPVIYEGMVIMLNWHVKGAFRVDLVPLRNNVKGNTAHVVLSRETYKFSLVAHTLKGKITKELCFDPSQIRQIHTMNISREVVFGQPTQELVTGRYYYNENNPLSSVNKGLLERIISDKGRIYAIAKRYYSGAHRLYFTGRTDKKSRALNAYIHSTVKGGTFKFSPKAYNKAIAEYKQNNKTII